MSDKPTMTKREKSWLVHLARNRALEKARAEGNDALATETLMDAVTFADGYPLGEYRLTYNGATISLVEKLQQRYSEAREMLSSAHIVFLLAEPDEAWRMLRKRSTFNLDEFEECIYAFMQSLTGEQITAANKWFEEEKARLEAASTEVPDVPQVPAGTENSATAPADPALAGSSP